MTAGVPVWLAVALSVLSGTIGAAGTIVALRYAWRKDKREQAAHEESKADTEADRTIELLEKQNDLLEKQNQKLEEQNRDLREERKELRSRVDMLDRDYRTLVQTVTQMGLCARARTCGDYNPGDRRIQHAQAQDS